MCARMPTASYAPTVSGGTRTGSARTSSTATALRAAYSATTKAPNAEIGTTPLMSATDSSAR